MHADAFSGIWHNERGSELEIEVAPDGSLAGWFRPHDGLGAGERFPVVGFAKGKLIAFSAAFGKLGSMTGWVGHVVADGGEPALDTLWQMTLEQPHPDRVEEQWKSVWTGADRFTSQSAAAP